MKTKIFSKQSDGSDWAGGLPGKAASPRKPAGARLVTLVSACLLSLATLTARADLSAPDNIIYGIIVLGTNQVTAEMAAVSVEARANGLRLARYRMGERADVGNHYLLSVRVEEMAPRVDPACLLVGDVVSIVILSNEVEQTQKTYTIAERGEVKRLDFGSLPTNVLPGFELWALACGLDADSQALDGDGDGISNLGEFVAGTSPTNASSKFLLRITGAQQSPRIAFDALRAEGMGYENVTRHYALERAATAPGVNWQTVPGFADVLGANQEVAYQAPADGGPFFYRGVVWLTPGAAQDELRLSISRDAGQTVISFATSGADAQGRNHYYTLEQTTNLTGGTWTAVPECSNVLGGGQTVSHTVSGAGQMFYRGRCEVR